MPASISIILRTRNEERWIAACLRRIRAQTVRDVEVVVVDNDSTDHTVARALSVMPDLKLLRVADFLPGYAINEGIRASDGEYIVCLSAHCIPCDEHWLANLLRNFDNEPELAGVYGRQIPMHFTNRHDKRDLLVTFGLDRRVQRRDPFFHNANSMFPRAVWERFAFDEKTTNIEDRLWARQVLDAGYHIVYEPEATVYHHHGIYQNRNEQRLRNVITIIDHEMPPFTDDESHPFHYENLDIAAVIPVREEPDLDADVHDRLLELAVREAKAAASVQDVIVTTNSPRLAALAERLGASVPFLRDDSLATPAVPVVTVLQQAIEWHEARGRYFDYVATLELTHPFRPPGIVQQCIDQALATGLEAVIAGVAEFRPCWLLEDEQYKRLDDYLHRRSEREPIHVGLPAICSVVTPSVIRSGRRIADRVAIVEVHDPLAQVEIRSNQDVTALAALRSLRSAATEAVLAGSAR